MAIQGFWDDFGMNEAIVIFDMVQETELPDALICEEGKHFLDPREEILFEMSNVASAICRSHELTMEARQEFGDLSLVAWWLDDRFSRRNIEMAQEALARAEVARALREECERKLDWATFFLTNAETVAQEVVECL